MSAVERRAVENPIPLWDELVTASVIGTERRPFRGVEVPDGIAELIRGGDLLTTASAIWAYRQAGVAVPPGPTVNGPAGTPAPPAADDRPLLPAAARHSLEIIVSDRRFTPLLGEWLALAAARGDRLPPELVPRVLDATPPGSRADAVRIAGPLAAWLAAYRAEWAWARPAPGSEARTVRADGTAASPAQRAIARALTGSDEERVAAVVATRSARPRPPWAGEFFEALWAAEPATTRVGMVKALATGLTAEDEPFLEACLDDRRKDVRRAAAALLARLPGSRFAARMTARAVALVRVERAFRPRLVVRAAPDPDAAAIRDGVEPPSAEPSVGGGRGGATHFSSPNRATGERLGQIVAATPLGVWSSHLGRSPEELVRMAHKAEATALLAGWSAAAVAQGDLDWARALVAGAERPSADLLAALPRHEAAQALVKLLTEQPLPKVLDLVVGQPGTWTAALTIMVFEALKGVIANSDPGAALPVREALPALAQAVDPGQASAASALAGALDPRTRAFWERHLAAFAGTVHFRLAMRQELR